MREGIDRTRDGAGRAPGGTRLTFYRAWRTRGEIQRKNGEIGRNGGEIEFAAREGDPANVGLAP